MEKKLFKPTQLPLAEFEMREFLIYVPDDVDVEDFLKPETWEHVALDLNPWDTIYVRWEDMSKECMLRVMDVTKTSARVILLGDVIQHDLSDDQLLERENLYVKHAGAAKWRVMRKNADGKDTVIETGLSTRIAAESALLEHLK